MPAFHAFVTGMADRYSGIKAEKRNLKGQKELQALVNSGKATPTNTKTFGSMTFTPTDVSDFEPDRKIYQGLADYANMFDANDEATFNTLSASDKQQLTTDVLGAWDSFTDLVSPGTGGSGENIKEYYRKFSNLDAFSKMPELHQRLLESDPTNSILGKVVYDSNHEILGIGNKEQGTPAIFQPDDIEGMIDKDVPQGEMTSIPSSLVMKPKKWGGTYDFGGEKEEKLFYDNVASILTSRQFGSMELAQAKALMEDEKNPWKSFAVYAAYGNSTNQMSEEIFGREMAEIQSIYGISDKELFNTVSLGVQKYNIQPGATSTRVNITRRYSDLTEKQKAAMNNAVFQADAVIEDTGRLLDAWAAGDFKPGVLGPVEKFARGIYFDEGSILKELSKLDNEKNRHLNFIGPDGKRQSVGLGVSTFSNNPKDKGTLAWHIAGLRKSIEQGKTNKMGATHYYNYETGGWVKKEEWDMEGLNYQAKKVLEMSLAYRLTVMEQGSGGNTISDKDFQASLNRIKAGAFVSREQIIGGLSEIMSLAARTKTLAALQAEHETSGIKLPLLYAAFREQKGLLWDEIEEKFQPWMMGGEDGTINNPNDVMANRIGFLKGSLNWKLGIFNRDEALFGDLSTKELSEALDDVGFWVNSDNKLGVQTTNANGINKSGNGEPVATDVIVNNAENNDQSVSNENLWIDKTGTYAKEGYIKLPAKLGIKRPTVVPRDLNLIFGDDVKKQEALERIQKEWDVNYGQWYNPDGTLKSDMGEISFADLNKLFQTKSRIIKLIKSRKIPRPDNLPYEVPARPELPKGDKKGIGSRYAEESPERKEIMYKQKAWDLKYSRYYNPDGRLIVNPGQVDKSLLEKTREVGAGNSTSGAPTIKIW